MIESSIHSTHAKSNNPLATRSLCDFDCARDCSTMLSCMKGSSTLSAVDYALCTCFLCKAAQRFADEEKQQ